MRLPILLALLATPAFSLSFLQKAEGFLSGSSSSSNSSSSSLSGSSILSSLQNSSLGQAVSSGIDFYNSVKNGSSSVINTTSIEQTIANSSLGEVVQSGIDFYNNLKNGSSYTGNASDILSNFVPFVSNASAAAQAEFYALLPNISSMTILEFETAVNAWAAKYNLTEEVDAFNQRAQNLTQATEDHANEVIVNLPNVLNNLKTIVSNKNQTVFAMHTSMLNYVTSLDSDTRDIVVVLFSGLLPPEFKQISCTGGNLLTNIYQKATDFFNSNQNSSGSNSFASFFNSFSNTSSSNLTFAVPHVGILSNFLNKNNMTTSDVSSVLGDVNSDTLSIAAVTTTTKKNKKQANKKKNKKKATTTAVPKVESQVL